MGVAWAYRFQTGHAVRCPLTSELIFLTTAAKLQNKESSGNPKATDHPYPLVSVIPLGTPTKMYQLHIVESY